MNSHKIAKITCETRAGEISQNETQPWQSFCTRQGGENCLYQVLGEKGSEIPEKLLGQAPPDTPPACIYRIWLLLDSTHALAASS